MKSLLLLINLFVVSGFAYADDSLQEKIFGEAKAAYLESDCRSTNYYLQKYLKISTPSKEKYDSIVLVMEWCQKFLARKPSASIMSGFLGPSKSFIKTKEQRVLLKIKPDFPKS
uniref:hypothetical protein n=1 Tax=Marinobacterium profundum TaxID=1714300 RepID=UPI000AF44133|nr:hypothetical protein [Marinobacterium profundum]